MIRFLVSCLLFLVIFTGPIYAIEDIGQSEISPASPLYFLKIVKENIELKLAFTPNIKMIRELEFATRRLREVNSLIPINRQELIPSERALLIEPTLERYWYFLQNVPGSGPERQTLAIHLETLERIYDRVTNQRARMAIRASINRLIGRADLPQSSKLLACTFLTKEASSSALTEVERSILLERSANCFKSDFRIYN